MKTSATMAPPRLRITDVRGFEKTVLIDKDVFPIGREAAGGLVLPDEEPSAVSARHALIIRDGDTFVLKAQAGSCGTRVNGRPIRSTVLKHGDQIGLGASALRIVFLVEGSRATDMHEAKIRLLLDVLRELHSALETREICARAAAGIMGLIGSAWAAVALEGPSGDLEIVAALDTTGTLPGAPSGIALHVAGTARSYFHPVRLCVPVTVGERPAGVIDAGPRETTPYRAADMQLLEALAAHLGVALGNARRFETSRRPSTQEASAR